MSEEKEIKKTTSETKKNVDKNATKNDEKVEKKKATEKKTDEKEPTKKVATKEEKKTEKKLDEKKADKKTEKKTESKSTDKKEKKKIFKGRRRSRNDKEDRGQFVNILKWKVPTTYVYVAAIAAFIVVVIAIIVLVKGRYKTPINNMYKGIGTNNQGKMIEAFSDDVEDVLEKANKDDGQIKGIINMYKDNFYQDGMTDIDYETVAKVDVVDNKLKVVQDEVNQFLSNNGSKEKVEVEQGYQVCVKISYTMDTKECSELRVISVYKMNGDWGVWYTK